MEFCWSLDNKSHTQRKNAEELEHHHVTLNSKEKEMKLVTIVWQTFVRSSIGEDSEP